MATMTAPAPAGGDQKAGAGGGKNAPVILRPFVAGTRQGDKSTYDQTRQLLTSTIDLPTYECDPNGFLGGAYILVEAASSGNSAAVAFVADGPFSVIDTITLNDTNNKPIIGPMTGHDLYTFLKHAGYNFVDDAKQSPVYSVTTGSGGTGGAFSFILQLPIEIVKRDALGALPNKSASATFDVAIRLSPLSNLYSTAPTVAPTVRLRIEQFGWMDPSDTDIRGNAVAQNPPAVQTTQYVQKQTYTLNAGPISQRLIGIDGLVRNLMFELRDGSGSRAQGDADFPDPFVLQYETSTPVNRLRTIWRDMIAKLYGYFNTVETAGGRDYALYPLTYCQDFCHKPGYETRLGYLPFSSATTANISGTISGSGAHTLIVFVNKVIPGGGDPLAITGR